MVRSDVAARCPSHLSRCSPMRRAMLRTIAIPSLLVLIAFLITFGLVRAITFMTHLGVGPFHNVTSGDAAAMANGSTLERQDITPRRHWRASHAHRSDRRVPIVLAISRPRPQPMLGPNPQQDSLTMPAGSPR